MIATAMAAMFALTYANSYRLADVKWSETRFYMTFVMGAAMAVIVLGFMMGMYRSRKTNVAIMAGNAIVFCLALWLVRSQATVEDESYIRAMIPALLDRDPHEYARRSKRRPREGTGRRNHRGAEAGDRGDELVAR